MASKLGRRSSISLAENGSSIRRLLIRAFGWVLTGKLVFQALRGDWRGAVRLLIVWLTVGTLARGSQHSILYTLLGLGGPRERKMSGTYKPGYKKVYDLLERQLEAGMHHGAQVRIWCRT